MIFEKEHASFSSSEDSQTSASQMQPSQRCAQIRAVEMHRYRTSALPMRYSRDTDAIPTSVLPKTTLSLFPHKTLFHDL